MTDSLRDLQRLADRTVHRYGRISSPLSRVDLNHLHALVAEIEAAAGGLLPTVDNPDELDLVHAQLALLKGILSRNEATPESAASLLAADSESDSDDRAPLISPRPPGAGQDARFALGLRQRAPPKQRKAEPDAQQSGAADRSIFRPEHDELSRDLLEQSLALRANSSRMATLLRDDAGEVSHVERLMDTTEGDFAGHTKKLSVQTKAESWGFLWILCVLVLGFLVFLFMFVFISIS